MLEQLLALLLHKTVRISCPLWPDPVTGVCKSITPFGETDRFQITLTNGEHFVFAPHEITKTSVRESMQRENSMHIELVMNGAHPRTEKASTLSTFARLIVLFIGKEVCISGLHREPHQVVGKCTAMAEVHDCDGAFSFYVDGREYVFLADIITGNSATSSIPGGPKIELAETLVTEAVP